MSTPLYLIILLLLRVLWMARPQFLTCLIFWTMGVSFGLLNFEGHFADYTMLIATFCNGTVTLANNGYMPVSGKGNKWSLWATKDNLENPRLLFLSDRFRFGRLYYSIGDVFIVVGLLYLNIEFIVWLIT